MAAQSAVYDAFRFYGQFVSCQKYFIMVSSQRKPERKDVSKTWSISMTLAGVRMAKTAAFYSFIRILKRTRPMNTQNLC